MATNFDRYLATVNADLMKFVDADDYTKLISPSDYMTAVYGGKKVLCLHVLDKDGTDFVFNADDEFETYVDFDLLHTEIDGTLNNAYSGDVTTIVATLASDPTYKTGRLVFENAAGEIEAINYTNWTNVSTAYTFTVSATLTYSYASGDDCGVEDEIMIKSDNSMVDIADDWSAVDRATGRISIRLDAFTRACYAKLRTNMGTNGILAVTVDVKRYITGDSTPGQILLDKAYIRMPVGTVEGVPATTGPSSYNAAQIDVLLAAKAKLSIESESSVANGATANLNLDLTATYKVFILALMLVDSTDATKFWAGIIPIGHDESGNATFASPVSWVEATAILDSVTLATDQSGGYQRLNITNNYGQTLKIVYGEIHRFILPST